MPQDSAVVDQLLTRHSNGLFNNSDFFIAEQILPAVAVGPTTGKVPAYGTEHLRLQNTVHRGKGNYNEVETLVYNTDTYDITDHGLFETVTDAQKRNALNPFDALQDATTGLTHLQFIAKEKALADALTATATITQNTTLSGNSQYNNRDHADSTPIEDKNTAFGTIEDSIGMEPNTAIMSPKVARALKFHAQLLDALGYKDNRPGGLNDAELAKALGVDRVLIGRGFYNSAARGQSDSIAQIWGKDLVFARIEQNVGLRQKTLGIEVRKSGTSPRQVRRFNPAMPVNSTQIICTDNYDQLLLNVECAYLIKNAIA